MNDFTTNNDVPEMPICVACKRQMHYQGEQQYSDQTIQHYCECKTVGCALGVPADAHGEWIMRGRPADSKPHGSTYVVEGYHDYVLRAGYSEAQYQAAQALLKKGA